MTPYESMNRLSHMNFKSMSAAFMKVPACESSLEFQPWPRCRTTLWSLEKKLRQLSSRLMFRIWFAWSFSSQVFFSTVSMCSNFSRSVKTGLRNALQQSTALGSQKFIDEHLAVCKCGWKVLLWFVWTRSTLWRCWKNCAAKIRKLQKNA